MTASADMSAGALLQAGLAARSSGELARAQDYLEQAVATASSFGAARTALAEVLIALGRHKDALPHVEAALALDPGDAGAQHCLGLLFLDRALFGPAQAAFERCIELDPTRIDAWRNLAGAQRSNGDPHAAVATIERALRRAPGDRGLEATLAALCELLGQHERVLEILAPNGQPRTATVDEVLTLAASLRALERDNDARVLLEDALDTAPTDARFRIEFALAAQLDHAGEYDRAFTHTEQANRNKRACFDPAAYRNHVEAIMNGFMELRAVPSMPGSQSRRPIFIVGMPRSGTSLVEQIVAAHPFVTDGGELGDIMLLAQSHANRQPGGMQALDAAELAVLARSYLDTLERIDGAARHVTDKMWENFEYLGFIERVFPRARVIHCRRDPFDVAISCWFQHFARANGVPFSYDLAHIGAFWRQYERLMSFWRRESSLEMLEISYEDVVSDLAGQARRAIAFLGLEWSDACLSFHDTGRIVNTASYAQVRRPIYSSSIGRWRHYRAHLHGFAEAAGLPMPVENGSES
ncbi:tetratricopeptide repeat protein [soil metagenome]